MDCNGLLWISKNQVNGFEDASMDCYGMFKKRGSDTEEPRVKEVSKINGSRTRKGVWYNKFTTNSTLR